MSPSAVRLSLVVTVVVVVAWLGLPSGDALKCWHMNLNDQATETEEVCDGDKKWCRYTKMNDGKVAKECIGEGQEMMGVILMGCKEGGKYSDGVSCCQKDLCNKELGSRASTTGGDAFKCWYHVLGPLTDDKDTVQVCPSDKKWCVYTLYDNGEVIKACTGDAPEDTGGLLGAVIGDLTEGVCKKEGTSGAHTCCKKSLCNKKGGPSATGGSSGSNGSSASKGAERTATAVHTATVVATTLGVLALRFLCV